MLHHAAQCRLGLRGPPVCSPPPRKMAEVVKSVLDGSSHTSGRRRRRRSLRSLEPASRDPPSRRTFTQPGESQNGHRLGDGSRGSEPFAHGNQSEKTRENRRANQERADRHHRFLPLSRCSRTLGQKDIPSSRERDLSLRPRASFTRLRRTSGRTGLTRKSIAPRRMASTAFRIVPWADTTIVGTSRPEC